MSTPSRFATKASLRTAAILMVVAIVGLLASCGQTEEPVAERSAAGAPPPGPSASDVDGLSARAALALANRWKDSVPSVTSIVDTQRVAFQFADGSTAEVPLPADEMVVAIAPYVKNTHPCAVHVMSGCQGELVGAPLKVRGVTSDGVVVIDEQLTTMANGFVEVWLPRNLELALSIEFDGLQTTGTIRTYADSNTCITTMQLL